ncbi:MAG: asparagine synthase (glutamine-hydrolyzing) [Thermoleophilaceae bacterium]
MCGIAGKVDWEGAVDETTIARMCAAIEHRGPDSRGIHLEDGVGIGAQRLAIIDLAHGDQPVTNEDGSVVVALNGEIYNFQELRERLLANGHRFRSYVDTEVLAHLYEELGPAMVHELRGMFAFAVWDARERRLFCARDRAGKKPLFWARRGSRVWFASEVRSLLQDPDLDVGVDPRAIDAYLSLQYVPHPLSAFSGVSKLPPASTMVFDAAGERVERYWSLDFAKPAERIARPEAEERLRELIREATRVRLVSEVPLGAFLSGGVDSSVVVAAMAEATSVPVRTFSIGFREREFDEVRYARMVAEQFGTDHHEFQVEPEALSIMPKLARHYGEPYADPSAIPSFYLAELTRQHVTVALNGDGGDESFAGYSRYRAIQAVSRLGWSAGPIERAGRAIARRLGEGARDNSTRSRINRLVRAAGMAPADRYLTWMSPFGAERRASLLADDFRASLDGWSSADVLRRPWAASDAPNLLDTMLDVDVQTYLPDNLLVKMDIATMASSLEARSPFLDHHVMEFAASLPAEYKIERGEKKSILKSAYRDLLPHDVLYRPKMGFGVPLAHWFRGELRDMPSEVLLDPGALDRGYFRRAEVERLIAEHRDGAADHALRLWVLLQLEMWHREVADPATRPAAAVAGAQ